MNTTTRSAADVHPCCPNCGRPIAELLQPDPREPDQLLAACTAQACGCWTVFIRIGARLRPAGRITAADRRSPAWPAARSSALSIVRRA